MPPCLAINGHPIAPVFTILRQGEAPLKIYSSRWFPASIYNVKWSIKAGQWSNTKKIQKIQNFNFFFEFCIDPGGPGGHLGGSRTDFGAEKH